MDPSFVQLLNDGVYNDNEEMNSQTPLSSQPQDLTSKSKKGRSKNFTIQEDILLISAWKNVSLDPIQGNNQTQQTYWSRITSYYNEYKTFPSERTPSSLCNRWSSIQLCVSKFQGFHIQIEGRNQSGVSEEDKIREACSMYQKIQGSSFPYMHCWTELRHSPKFAPNQPKSKKNKTSPNDESPPTPSSGGSPASVNFEIENDDMTERPLGRKAAKRLKKLNLESKEDAFKVLLTEMKENLTSTAQQRMEAFDKVVKMEEERVKMEEERHEWKRAKEERERQLYEASIMEKDTINMEPHLATYYNSLKANILKKLA